MKKVNNDKYIYRGVEIGGNHMDNIVLNETAQEFYDVINDSCPICGRKFIAPSNIVRLGRVAYDLECYLEATNMGGNSDGK